MSADERQAAFELPRTFAHLWHDPQTSQRERKRLVRVLIEDVTLLKAEQIRLSIRFKGGATRTLTLPLPPPFAQSRLTPSETLAEIDHLLDAYTDAEVADQLNIRGLRTFAGLPFQAMHVSQLRRAHGLRNRYARLREQGLLTAAELATRLGVREQTIWRWYRRGAIQGMRYNDRGTCLFKPPDVSPGRGRLRHTIKH